MNDKQARQILYAYETAAVRMSRLPYSDTLNLMAEEAGCSPADVWNFLLDCSGRGAGNGWKLPTINQRDGHREDLDPDSCELFEKELPKNVLAGVESYLYRPETEDFFARHPEKHPSVWANEMIRYRKFKVNNPDGTLPSRHGLKRRLGENLVVAVNSKERLIFVGSAPAPIGFDVLQALSESEAVEIRRSLQSWHVSGDVFHGTREDINVDEEVIL